VSVHNSLDAIIRGGQWNALQHGYYAYYSAAALSAMLAAQGFRASRAWQFDLYGGTVLLAACRDGEMPGAADGSVHARGPAARRAGQGAATARLAGRRAVGRAHRARHGAASRAVALLRCAEADQSVVQAVADASPAKQGRRMPGTDIPVVSPAQLAGYRPSAVALFLANLLPEVCAAYPEAEAAGGRWVTVELLSSAAARG